MKTSKSRYLKALSSSLVLISTLSYPAFLKAASNFTPSPQPFLNSSEIALLNEILNVHLNYFVSTQAVTAAGLPLTAYKEGDRARFGYSNPTEWGYAMMAWMVAADRGKITVTQAATRMGTALDTIGNLQNNASQNYRKLFYPFYTVVNSQGVDLAQPFHDADPMIPSIDNGFLYTSLLITEGWARSKSLTQVADKAKAISSAMNFRMFLNQGGNLMSHQINATKVLFIGLILSGLLGFASLTDAGRTNAGLILLEVPSARPAALGQAFSAVPDDASSFLYNPANLSSLKTGQVSFLYQNGVFDDSIQRFSLGHRFGGKPVSHHQSKTENFLKLDGSSTVTFPQTEENR